MRETEDEKGNRKQDKQEERDREEDKEETQEEGERQEEVKEGGKCERENGAMSRWPAWAGNQSSIWCEEECSAVDDQ